jgi:PP-loop superfamily ATP-utilizing enzyme
LRVRHRGDRARIEAEPDWIPWLIERSATITERLVALGFPAVDIDSRGYRRGSLILETTGER